MTNEEVARQIISKILYITIATSSEDNQPWNSPVYSAFDEKYNFYWLSDKNGQHSKNIATNDRIFLVIYDSLVSEGTGKGVYVQARAHALSDEEEIQKALTLLYQRKGEDPHKRSPEEFLGNYPRRAYKAIPEKMWINGHGEVNGNYIDTRTELDMKLL